MGRPLYDNFSPVIAVPQEKTLDTHICRDVGWNPEGYTDVEWDRIAEREQFVDHETSSANDGSSDPDMSDTERNWASPALASGFPDTGNNDVTVNQDQRSDTAHVPPYSPYVLAEMDVDDVPVLEDVSDLSSSSSEDIDDRVIVTGVRVRDRPVPRNVRTSNHSTSRTRRSRRLESRAETLQALTDLTNRLREAAAAVMVPGSDLESQINQIINLASRETARADGIDFARYFDAWFQDAGDSETRTHRPIITRDALPERAHVSSTTQPSVTSNLRSVAEDLRPSSAQVSSRNSFSDPSNAIGEAIDLDFDDGATTRHQIVGLRFRERGSQVNGTPNRWFSDFGSNNEELRADHAFSSIFHSPTLGEGALETEEHALSSVSPAILGLPHNTVSPSEPIPIPLAPRAHTPPPVIIPFSSSMDTMGAPSPALNVTPRVYSWSRARRISASGSGSLALHSRVLPIPPTIGSLRSYRATARV